MLLGKHGRIGDDPVTDLHPIDHFGVLGVAQAQLHPPPVPARLLRVHARLIVECETNDWFLSQRTELTGTRVARLRDSGFSETSTLRPGRRS